MRLSRFSIAGLMALILFVALGFASLKSANEWWAGGLYLLTVVSLLLILLGALVGPGGHRPRWIGAAVFGWGYFVLVVATGVLTPPALPTARLIGIINTHLLESDPTPPAALTGTLAGFTAPSQISLGSFTVSTVPVPPPPTPFTAAPLGVAIPALNRFQVGHCLFSLAFAALGALAARIFTGTEDPAVPSPPTH